MRRALQQAICQIRSFGEVMKVDVPRISKAMSYVLRHGAIKEGIEITPDGWVSMDDLLAYLKTTREVVDQVVAENNKKRFEVEGDLIRAAQGHSMVVTPEAMEATWAKFEGSGIIYHGTNFDALAGIAEKGIVSVRRTHVHLADSLSSLVGKRSNVQLFLHVSTDKLRASGQEIFRSSNGVVLVRHVPTRCIEKIQILFEAPVEVDRVRQLFSDVPVTLTL